MLRLSLSNKADSGTEVIVIQTNIDDFNPEFLGKEFQEQLLNKGALDFYYNQIIMKKGRPGLVLTVICPEIKFDDLSRFILASTSTIGLRYYKTNRLELDRKIKEVKTEFGTFKVKVAKGIDGETKIKPESEEVLKYSLSKGINPNNISQKIIEAYEKENPTSA